jgi:hypothetical protein
MKYLKQKKKEKKTVWVYNQQLKSHVFLYFVVQSIRNIYNTADILN